VLSSGPDFPVENTAHRAKDDQRHARTQPPAREAARQGRSFALETTLSGRRYAGLIPEWRAAGYYVKLIFLNLPTPDLAVARVAARVAQGGHDVPESVIRRRFDTGLRNFLELYCDLVDRWESYDNSGVTPRLISMGGNP
jgi:predicted ABC-type ATPase